MGPGGRDGVAWYQASRDNPIAAGRRNHPRAVDRFAIVHAGGTFTNDEVVFGEPGDLVLLGAATSKGYSVPMTRAKYRGRSMMSGSVKRSGCQSSVEDNVSGSTSFGRHR